MAAHAWLPESDRCPIAPDHVNRSRSLAKGDPEGHVSPADAGLGFTRGVLRPVCPCRWSDIGAEC
jgi:hypothetical protein